MYRKLYYLLFHSITDAVDCLQGARVQTREMQTAVRCLKNAQQQAEQIYMDQAVLPVPALHFVCKYYRNWEKGG